MRHWSGLATRNWLAKPVRTLGAALAIALGSAAVVWVTCTFESVRHTVLEWADQYVGMTHITVESPVGKWGSISGSLLKAVEKVDGVKYATPLFMKHTQGWPVRRDALSENVVLPDRWSDVTPGVDLLGIDPEREPHVRKWVVRDGMGRMITPDDELECVVERGFAEEWGVGVGDVLFVWGGGRPEPYELEIVGLVERRRIAKFQSAAVVLPLDTLRTIASEPIAVTTIDIVLTDDAAKEVRASRNAISRALRRVPGGSNVNVATMSGRMAQIEKAQRQQEMVLALLGSVALLTALFIILSTLSMGMIERVSQLGLMRCVGVTGRQLAALVLFEVAPIGVLGVLIGVPLGLAMSQMTVWLAPEYVGQFIISWRGVGLAIGAGLATTFVAALLPMGAALTVSPLEASRPRARKASFILVLAAFIGAIVLLTAQWFGVELWVQRTPRFIYAAVTCVILLYTGYALVTPMIVAMIGAPAVWLASKLLGLRPRLLQDQVGHAVWRSSGIACGLMVGLSLIVGLVVFSESFKSGWQFPRQFPAAYIWGVYDQLKPAGGDADEALASVEGVGEFTTCNAINVIVEERPLFMEAVYASVTWFMGVDPEQFFDMVRVEFLEGDQASAVELMKKGGYVVIAEDFSNSRDKHVGDTIKVFHADRVHAFKVAAVITSPALDIAAGFFQANTEMRVVASGSVIGTNADVALRLGVQGRRLALLNFDLPPTPRPADWPPDRASRAGRYLGEAYYDTRIPLERRWERHRQEQVLREAADRLGAPSMGAGTVAELKDHIDYELTRVTRLLTAVPAIALIVAALGVANLMTANVTSRAKQLAILRAVGATKGLVLRLVIGEAIVLGVIGAALGVGLGLHLARDTTVLTQRMWGFAIEMTMPWTFVLLAIGATITLCVLAGVAPARNAARTNVVEALHVA